MLYSAKDVRKCRIEALDGELGRVHDLCFDDRDYAIRYVVVDTHTWLPGKRVLIPRNVLGTPDWNADELGVELTRDEIQSQPGVEADPPFAHQARLRHYHGYVWTTYPWGGFVGSIPVSPPAPLEPATVETHLRSAREVTSYHIEARDGSIGHVEDFLFDDDWTVRHVVVDTRNWLPGKKVLLSPADLENVAWPDRLVRVKLERVQVERAPELESVEVGGS